MADDVPVDVLPPQTIDEAIAALQTAFSEHPAVYADDARKLVNEEEFGESASEAGIAGGAYLTVAREHGEQLLQDDVSTALGVGAQTVGKSNDRFNYDD